MRNKISKAFLLFVFFGLIFLFGKGYLYKKEIEQYKEQTICKFFYCKQYPKTSSSYFKYYVDNNEYKNEYGVCPEKYEHKINKFFILHYSSKDPNKIKVDFSEQITDTTAILNAGFKKEELE